MLLMWHLIGVQMMTYHEKQQHESGNNIAVPAIIRPHQLSSSSDKVDSSIE